jgi:TldD protein
MEVEIKRYIKTLKKANPPVYFLSYRLTQSDTYGFYSTLGAQIQESKNTSRILAVEARAGSRAMDDSRKIKELNFDNAQGSQYGQQPPPLEDDVKNLRKSFWLLTEATAKAAQERYLKVKTNAQTASERSDNSDDFSAPLPPVSYYATAEFPQLDEAFIKERVNEYSAMFKGYDFILTSEAGFSVKVENVYFVNSEGVKLKTPAVFMRLYYNITSRNADGMHLERTNSYDFQAFQDWPDNETVRRDILKSIAELKALQNAPVADTYHGPVILKNRATGVFFHEILGHRVEGHRQKDDDFGQTFTHKLNQQIISPIISIYDNPALKEFKGTPLRGHYLYDSEGVKAQSAVIVKDGVLKGFLMGRSPIKGFPQSNGHGRAAPGKAPVSRMGVTMVEANKTVPFGELRAKLAEEIKKQGKPYGLIIEDISGGFTNTDTYGPQSFKVKPLLVYKVYADGRADEVIRGADIVGTPLASFNKIIAAADDYDIFNGSCGAESGWVPVSAIAPSVLISEMEIEKVEKTYDSLPLLPPPSAQAGTGGK